MDIDDELYVKLDPIAVDSIINNILDNVIKYSHPSGKIDVLLKSWNKKVKFTFRDNGIGIPQNKMD